MFFINDQVPGETMFVCLYVLVQPTFIYNISKRHLIQNRKPELSIISNMQILSYNYSAQKVEQNIFDLYDNIENGPKILF